MENVLRVIGLRASNVKRLETVEVDAPPGLVIVGGRNGSGKSSLLDSIWYALGGKTAQSDAPQPIRDGADHADVIVALGDNDSVRLLVERTWTQLADGTTRSQLTVRGGDGTRLSSPQAVLDALTGAGAFDPLEFVGLSAREQREVLLGLVELPFDLADIDEQRKAAFDERTDRNRELRSVDNRLDAMPRLEVPTDPPPPLSEAISAHTAALTVCVANAGVRAAFHRADTAWSDAQDAVEVARAALDVAVSREAQAHEARDRAAAAFDALDPDPDVPTLFQQVRDAEQFTAIANQLRMLELLNEERADLAKQIRALEDFMADVDETKRRGLAEAVMPYDGLGFGEESGITYHGKPFSQASAAERLRVAAAIAMAGDPTIRVMTIHDGSLLDDDNLAMLADMAAAHDFQVWLEVVGDDGTPTIVIDDGQVRP